MFVRPGNTSSSHLGAVDENGARWSRQQVMDDPETSNPVAIAVPVWDLQERSPALELRTKDNIIIIGSVLGALLIFSIIACVFYSIRKVQKRRSSEAFSSDDFGIKASVSTPSLSTCQARGKDLVQRSRSVGTSLSSSPSDITSSYYPQPDINEPWLAGANSSSSSSPPTTDPYSPFQRSFHIDNLPFLDISVKKNNEQLTVVISKFSELPDNVRSASGSMSSGLFVKAYLLPDELCRQTKIHPPTGTAEQVCNDVLSFEDTKANNCLLFSAYFIDTRHMRDALGHATIAVENGNYERSYRLQLEELANMLHYGVGELELTLCFLPDRSRLVVTLNSCKNLTLTDVRPSSKLVIKVQLLHGRIVVKEKRFRVTKMERNPVLNETCFLKMATKRADISHLLITLVEAADDDEEREIGQVAVGPYLYARGEGLLHWQTILSNAKRPTTMSHLFEAASDL